MEYIFIAIITLTMTAFIYSTFKAVSKLWFGFISKLVPHSQWRAKKSKPCPKSKAFWDDFKGCAVKISLTYSFKSMLRFDFRKLHKNNLKILRLSFLFL